MTRLQAMEDYLKPYFTRWVTSEIPIIKGEPSQQIILIMQGLFKQAYENQKNHHWIPAYFAVFFLESSLHTKTFEFQISLSNEHLYLDESQLTAFWTPDFMKRGMEQELINLRKILSQKFIRIKDYEVEHIFRLLIKQYRNMIEVYLQDIFRIAASQLWFADLPKQKPFVFIYGSYMAEIKSIVTV